MLQAVPPWKELVKAALPQVYIKCADTEVERPQKPRKGKSQHHKTACRLIWMCVSIWMWATDLCKRSAHFTIGVAKDILGSQGPPKYAPGVHPGYGGAC